MQILSSDLDLLHQKLLRLGPGIQCVDILPDDSSAHPSLRTTLETEGKLCPAIGSREEKNPAFSADVSAEVKLNILSQARHPPLGRILRIGH